MFGGCAGEGEDGADDRIQELRIPGLSSDARLHRVTLGGRGAEEHAVPTLIIAASGDAVEFRTVDHRVHTLSFLTDSLAPEVSAFLESTGQVGSPPLVFRGSRFILRLEGAPPGRYLFVSEGHGGRASGVVQVGPAGQADSSRD